MSASATSSGTLGVGSSNSIGTKTICVGTARPAPLGNSAEATSAYAATSAAARPTERCRSAGAVHANVTATTRKSTVKTPSATCSRASRRSPRRSRAAASSRWSPGEISV